MAVLIPFCLLSVSSRSGNTKNSVPTKMERTLSPTSGGHKVAQIANRFQPSSGSSNCSSGDDATPKRHRDASPDNTSPKDQGATPVVRTESHAARFNNARALFEKLGVESRLVSRPAAINGKMSKDSTTTASNGVGGGGVVDVKKTTASSPDKFTNGLRNGSTTNGVQQSQQHQLNGRSGPQPATPVAPIVPGGAKIFNVSRPKPEKPEKPERKFNSRELIEKQKNWTSHFSKARSSPRFNSDPNRCDIIRTVPTGVQGMQGGGIGNSPSGEVTPAQVVVAPSPPVPHRQHVPQSFDAATSGNGHLKRPEDDDDIPPCPPIRQNSIPEIKPRSIKPVIVGATTFTSNVNESPVKITVKRSPEGSPEKSKGEVLGSGGWGESEPKKDEEDVAPEKHRKISFDLIGDDSGSAGLGRSRSQSLDKENVISPGIGLSSSSSPMASISSEPTSPIHTEDEKQENEANEKTDLGLMTPTDGIDKSEGTDSGE